MGGTGDEACVLYQVAHEGKGELTSSGVAFNSDVLWKRQRAQSARYRT